MTKHVEKDFIHLRLIEKVECSKLYLYTILKILLTNYLTRSENVRINMLDGLLEKGSSALNLYFSSLMQFCLQNKETKRILEKIIQSEKKIKVLFMSEKKNTFFDEKFEKNISFSMDEVLDNRFTFFYSKK